MNFPLSSASLQSMPRISVQMPRVKTASNFQARKWMGWTFSLAFLAALCAVAVVGEDSKAQPFVWSDKTADFTLPPSIRIWEGVATAESGEPIRAWYADVDYNNLGLSAKPFLSSSVPLAREPVSQMARAQNAFVAINGGYFDMGSVPARTFSLVLQDNRVLVPNIARVTRPGRKYDVTRSAFGIRDNRTFDVAWIAHIPNDQVRTTIYRYDEPTRNTISSVAPPPSENSPKGAKVWDVQNAIGAGPTLISEGKLVDTFENEVFFGSGFSDNVPYARAAVGFTKRNHIVLFVTDGKQIEHSVGMTLKRLGEELQFLGCQEAMNLDGGGSETLVVNGKAINHPSDGRERNVTSMLAIVPSAKTEFNKSKPNVPIEIVPTAKEATKPLP